MLLNLREYHRPGAGAKDGQPRARLEQALALLERPGLRTVALAGGDILLGSADAGIEAVVDLQALGLDQIAVAGDSLRIGAMVSRAGCARLAAAGELAALVATGARRWGGNVQRNRATVGGAVAIAAANDALVVALLACDALVALYTEDGSRDLPLVEFLPARAAWLAAPALITDLIVPTRPAEGTGAALASVGRTPADDPIVVAAATITLAQGRCQAARLALGGVAAAPIRLSALEERLNGRPLEDGLLQVAAEQVSGMIAPAGDYRGSSEYRRTVAAVLSARVLREAWQRA